MVDRTGLTDLLAGLTPRADWVTEAQNMPNFTTRPGVIQGYVWPDVGELTDDLRPIVLIQSAGAMGKTSAARAIAHRLRSPLVDLASTHVGENSLTGLLAAALDWSGAAEFTEALRNGRSALVLDGLDEAQLLSGRENFMSFFQDVLRLVREGGPSAQVIMLGRHDAVETATLAMFEAGVEPTTLSLLPFTMRQSFELVDRTLDSQGWSVHRRNPVPFGELRDFRFADLASALLGEGVEDVAERWNEVDDFLGYAPVVQALAESLRVENPKLVQEQLKSASAYAQRHQRGELLKDIVEMILEREREKVSLRLDEALALADQSVSRLIYLPQEQVIRVVAAINRETLTVPPPQAIPPDKKGNYEDNIASFVLDHPFLRDREFASPVFSDYARAFVATAPLQDLFGVGLDTLLTSCRPVGPFFAWFVAAMASEPTGDLKSPSFAVASEDLVDDLIRSNSVGSAGTPLAMYEHGDKAPHLLVGEADTARPALVFHIADPAGVLVLRSPISHVYVTSKHGVRIEAVDGRLEIGPSVVIIADYLELVGTRASFFGSGAAPTTLIAREVVHDPQVTVSVHPADSLGIFWEGAGFQWRPHLLPSTGGDDDSLSPVQGQRLYQGLRRLLTGFRSGDEPWMYYERYDNFVIGANPLHRELQAALMSLSVLGRSGDRYTLDVDRLGDFGVNYGELHSANWHACLKLLAREVLKSQGVRAVFDTV
jgi:hypothetical protein